MIPDGDSPEASLSRGVVSAIRALDREPVVVLTSFHRDYFANLEAQIIRYGIACQVLPKTIAY